MKEKRINIGLFVSDLKNEFDGAVCQGVMQGAQEVDANLIVFPGRYLKGQYHDKERTRCEYQNNTLFSYADENNVDVLLVLLGTIGTVINENEKKVFLDMYKNIPVILLAEERKGYSSVSFDNRSGLRDGISNLILNKKCQNIGFVSGPVTNEDALERLEVYKQVLAANNIEYDETKVAYGNFSEYSTEIVSNLLEKHPKLDAIVFANDQMAIGGYKALKNKGYKIGKDILVMGFDDSVACQDMIPSLSTIRADAVELGRIGAIEAANYLVTRMDRKKYVKTTFIQRDSTGVGNLDILPVLDRRGFSRHYPRSYGMAARIFMDSILQDMRKDNDILYFSGLCTDFVREFFEQLHTDKEENQNPENLYSLIDKVMSSKVGETLDLTKVLTMLNSLKAVVSHYEEDKTLLAEKLIFAYLSHVTAVIFARKKDDRQNMDKLVWMSNCIAKDMLVYGEETDESYASVIDKLIKLGCRSAYLYSHKVPFINRNSKTWHDWQIPKTMLLKSYFNHDDDIVILESDRQEINSSELFTNEYMPADRRFTMIASNIFINEEQLGMLLTEINYNQIYLLAPLVAQLSSAFKIMNMLKVKSVMEKQLINNSVPVNDEEAVVETASNKDEITGLYNRRGFFELANKTVADSLNYGKHATLFVAEISNFKNIIDKHGRNNIENVLLKVTDIVKAAMRSSDIVARISPDEFAILTISDEDMDGEAIVSRINSFCVTHNNDEEKTYNLYMGVGFSKFICNEKENVEDHMEDVDVMIAAGKK